MSPLHMIELQPDLGTLLRFLRSQGLDTTDGDEDLGYGVHAWLAAAFGELAPKPWRLLGDRGRPPRVLGYSCHGAEELRQRMQEFATPAAFSVCPPDAIASRTMPVWRRGRRLAFEVQCCPVGRKAGTGVEKDLFLIRADAEREAELRRESVYCDWASEQLQRNGATTVGAIQLAGFRLVRQTRQTQSSAGARRRSHLLRPQALLRGELTVADPDAFSALLARGVGRHRAFGYGMLLLRPPS
jgi:CRISPR system Cascade subunit CasE